MEETTTLPTPSKARQQTRMRFVWFLAGSVVNYLLIATPFKWLDKHTDLSIWAVSASSLAVSTSFFFFWNYFINFRTDARKRDALPRYLSAVSLMFVLSSTTLTLLKHYDAQMAASLGPIKLDLDIVATQFFLAGLKFFLYHKWVFPPSDEAPAA